MSPGAAIFTRPAWGRRKSVALLFVLGAAVTLGLLAAMHLWGVGGAALFTAAVAVVVLFAYYRADSILLGRIGAIRVNPSDYPRLERAIDAAAIGSGLPLPRVYVVQDAAPNAFSLGRDPDHAAIGVTTGLIETLGDDELMAVVAHEMCHILNYDTLYHMVLSLLAMPLHAAYQRAVETLEDNFAGGYAAGGSGKAVPHLVFVALMLRLAPLIVMMMGWSTLSLTAGSFDARARSFVAPSPYQYLAVPLMLAAMMLGALAFAWLNRSRDEYADACAIRLTRDPHAYARALKEVTEARITLGLGAGGIASHIFYVNPRRVVFDSWSSYPPTKRRIKDVRAFLP